MISSFTEYVIVSKNPEVKCPYFEGTCFTNTERTAKRYTLDQAMQKLYSLSGSTMYSGDHDDLQIVRFETKVTEMIITVEPKV